MKTDVHSHLLPGIDDGSRRLAESEEILARLKEDGIEYLAFTPHFYPAQNSIDRFLDRREGSLRRLSESPLFASFHTTVGAEVYLTESLFNHDGIERLSYRDTGLILTELEYGVPWSRATERRLERLINDFSLTPVLAHIERFSDLLNVPERVAYLRDMGCLCQMNLQGFAQIFRKRKMLRLVREDMVDFLGQDLHRDALPAGFREKVLRELEKNAPGFVERCDAFAREVVFR